MESIRDLIDKAADLERKSYGYSPLLDEKEDQVLYVINFYVGVEKFPVLVDFKNFFRFIDNISMSKRIIKEGFADGVLGYFIDMPYKTGKIRTPIGFISAKDNSLDIPFDIPFEFDGSGAEDERFPWEFEEVTE